MDHYCPNCDSQFYLKHCLAPKCTWKTCSSCKSITKGTVIFDRKRRFFRSRDYA